MFDVEKFKYRDKPAKYIKLEENSNSSNVVHSKRKKKYEYYRCDYCNCEIRLDLKEWQKKNGGVIALPYSLTGYGNITLALCNSCLNKVINELEKAKVAGK